MTQEQTQPDTPRKIQILGLHPALFIGIVLLVLVAILSIVLVFTGDIAAQGWRVFWTVVSFVGFTGLLALDLSLSKKGSRPLVIGTVANSYMIIVLMLSIWIFETTDTRTHDSAVWDLIFVVPYIAIITRAAWALAWLTLSLGFKIKLAIGRGFGIVTAGLAGVAGVLLTLNIPLARFGIEAGDWYWRILVSVIILAALSACILLLLVWNQRNNDPRPPKQPGQLPPQFVQAPGQVPPSAPGAPYYGAPQQPNPYGQQRVQNPTQPQHPGQPPQAPPPGQYPQQ